MNNNVIWWLHQFELLNFIQHLFVVIFPSVLHTIWWNDNAQAEGKQGVGDAHWPDFPAQLKTNTDWYTQRIKAKHLKFINIKMYIDKHNAKLILLPIFNLCTWQWI